MRRYQYEIHNYLRKYLEDDDLAEDAFQLTFLSVFRKSSQFDLSRRFRPWLYGIATNQAIDLHRSLNRRQFRSLDAPMKLAQGGESTKADQVADHRCTKLIFEQAEFSQKMRQAIDEVGEPGRRLDLPFRGCPIKMLPALNAPVGTVKAEFTL